MPSKFELGTLAGKLIFGAASAAVLGGGTAIITSARVNAVQDEQLAALKKDQADLASVTKELRDTVQQLDKNVAVLNDRLKDRQ